MEEWTRAVLGTVRAGPDRHGDGILEKFGHAFIYRPTSGRLKYRLGQTFPNEETTNVKLKLIAAAIGCISALSAAQQCGGSSCSETTDRSACSSTAKTGQEIDAQLAKKLADAARRPQCSTIARRDFMTYLPFADTETAAEKLVALVREAPTPELAAKIILNAAADARKPATRFAAGLPDQLSTTGFFASILDARMIGDFQRYAVNVPLWSDDAKKERFIAVPSGKKVGFRRDGEWDIPVGTIFLQTLFLEDSGQTRRTETRVIVKEVDGLRFASYAWNEDQKDAVRKPDGDEFYANVGKISQSWRIESADSCARCHNDVSGMTLGFNTLQLNRVENGVNQLATLEAKGILSGLPEKCHDLPSLASPTDENAPLESRVRSYLHTNCSTCHRPGGPGSGTLDLRLDTPLAHTGLLRSRTSAGRGGVVKPGQPKRSALLHRMGSVDWDRMPSLLSTVPDDSGMKMIGDWVKSLNAADVKKMLDATPAVLVEKKSTCGADGGCGNPMSGAKSCESGAEGACGETPCEAPKDGVKMNN